MKKSFSLAELQKEAAPHFARFNVDTLYATVDGQFFLLENRARLHAGTSGTVYQLKKEPTAEAIAEATNDTVGTESADKVVLSITALKKAVADKTLDELHTMLDEETNGGNRKGAIAVIEAAIEVLK